LLRHFALTGVRLGGIDEDSGRVVAILGYPIRRLAEWG
jgi:hypothetical protein